MKKALLITPLFSRFIVIPVVYLTGLGPRLSSFLAIISIVLTLSTPVFAVISFASGAGKQTVKSLTVWAMLIGEGAIIIGTIWEQTAAGNEPTLGPGWFIFGGVTIVVISISCVPSERFSNVLSEDVLNINIWIVMILFTLLFASAWFYLFPPKLNASGKDTGEGSVTENRAVRLVHVNNKFPRSNRNADGVAALVG